MHTSQGSCKNPVGQHWDPHPCPGPGPNLGYFIVKIGFAGMVHPRTAQILEHGGCRCSLLQFEAAKTRITKQFWQRRVIT